MEQTLVNSSWTIDDVLDGAECADIKMTKEEAERWLSSNEARDLGYTVRAFGIELLEEHLSAKR